MEALLVIDMQNDFLSEDAPLKCEGGQEIIPNVVKAIEKARAQKIPVIHVIQEHRRDMSDFGRELECSKPHCIEGTYGAKIVSEIQMAETDYLIVKKRFSSFFATELDLLLRSLGVSRIFLTGVATDGCIRATAVDAHQLGYYFKIIKGCIAGAFYDSHEAALKYMCRLQKDVLVDLEEIWNS
jgi:nicotinamidase-related amidase